MPDQKPLSSVTRLGYFKSLGNKYTYKIIPNIQWLFGLFAKGPLR